MSVPSIARSALAPVALLCASAALADVPGRASAFGRLPLTFERNTGRYDERVKFLTRTATAADGNPFPATYTTIGHMLGVTLSVNP